MFTKEYWKSSTDKLKSTKYLALMAAFIAMKVILSGIYIPISENLHIGVSFLVIAIEASILGPVSGMVSGFVTDILSFAIFPSGAFFFGYTLTAMLGELIYALFLYRQKITILKIALAKIITNYLLNVAIGSIWSSMLYGNVYLYYAAKSLIKNTLLLPFEILGLVVLFNLLLPFLKKQKFHESDTPIPLVLK